MIASSIRSAFLRRRRPLAPAIAVAAVLGLLVSGGASAQSRTTGGLGGRVVGEDDAPLPGTIVQIESPALIGGPRAAVADRDGRYRFPELPPGAYTISARLTGYRTLRIEGVLLSAGMGTEAPIHLTPYAGEETVGVSAQPIAIDPRSSATTTVLPPEFLENIPTDRDTSHILDLAPGINLESAYGGAEESGNSYEMDGVDISDPEGGVPWSFFNYTLIESVDLVGLGAPAEYGEFTGVVFNSVTRSGGNDPSGMAEIIYAGRAITGSNTRSRDLSATIQQHADAVVQAGGPIRRDRLWYFVSGQIIGRDGDAFTPLEATTGEDNPELVWNLSWRSVLSDSSILTVAWGGYTGQQHFIPHNGFSVPGHLDAETDLASGNARLFELRDRIRNQVNASFIHHVGAPAGDHEFKVGTEIERSTVHNRTGFPGGAFFVDKNGPVIDPSTGQPDFYTLGSFGGASDIRARNERISLYAQDSWGITPRFTLNPGLRLDVNRGIVSSGTVFRTSPLSPRLGFAWDLRGDGRSILRAHYGRYAEALYAAFYYDMDPSAIGPLTTKRTFDTSGYTETLSSVAGQKFAMDRHIRQPTLDQYVLGFDRAIGRGVVISGTLVHRRNAHLIETVSRDGRFVPVRGLVPGTGQRVTLFDYLNPSTDV
ncbi:MAG: hypothetical protein DMF49_09720, partial [Acidobacteria bacterium]